jgi:excisionase family DNA binding protein
MIDLKTMERDALLTPSEVAGLFRVDPKTVNRWARAHRIKCIRTPGGHTRYFAGDVSDLLEANKEAE